MKQFRESLCKVLYLFVRWAGDKLNRLAIYQNIGYQDRYEDDNGLTIAYLYSGPFGINHKRVIYGNRASTIRDVLYLGRFSISGNAHHNVLGEASYDASVRWKHDDDRKRIVYLVRQGYLSTPSDRNPQYK